MSCEHKWVIYQPFQGEAYECCALAGCGITRAEYEKSLNGDQLSLFDLRSSDEPLPYNSPWIHYNDQAEREKEIEKMEDLPYRWWSSYRIGHEND